MNLPVIQDPLLVTVDMQERLVPAMTGSEEVVARVKILLQGAAELKIPVIATEQYPKGLGPTLPEISELFPEGTVVPAKTSFSVFGEPEFRVALGRRRPPLPDLLRHRDPRLRASERLRRHGGGISRHPRRRRGEFPQGQ